MATSTDEIQTMAHHLNLTARKYGLNTSRTKRKSMAMCGNCVQRVKIVTNDKTIKQVSDFKHQGYLISYCKSCLEDKLPTYNRKNGIIRRHLGNRRLENKTNNPQNHS
jgi:hypothetical protein